ncbi:hypothetical protein PIROE2DRAFT_9508, partial [Piromyces sp. E2]
DDRPLLNINKGKPDHSLILPSPTTTTSTITDSMNPTKYNKKNRPISVFNTSSNTTMDYDASRQEIDDFFFNSDTLPDISNNKTFFPKINSNTISNSNSNSNSNNNATTITTTTTTINKKRKYLHRHKHQ